MKLDPDLDQMLSFCEQNYSIVKGYADLKKVTFDFEQDQDGGGNNKKTKNLAWKVDRMTELHRIGAMTNRSKALIYAL